MLCRRCGLDSSATDVCEWCKRPMLPPGAAIAGKKALGAKGQPQPAPQGPPAAQAPPAMPAADGLLELKAAVAPDQVAAPEGPAAAEDTLRPLGGGKAAAGPGVLSHGLSDEATRTSVNVANYLGPDQSLFKPVQHAEFTTQAAAGMDPLAQRRRKSEEKKAVSDIPDNVRLMRALFAGIAICLPLAILQFALTHTAPEKLSVLPLGKSENFTTALLYGVSSGAFLGFGLGALLVQIKKGPFLGLFIGLVLGNFFLATEPRYWGIAAATLTGIAVGRIATVGYRRALQI